MGISRGPDGRIQGPRPDLGRTAGWADLLPEFFRRVNPYLLGISLAGYRFQARFLIVFLSRVLEMLVFLVLFRLP
jgi:hypothetical protein